jgi:hypothetical protein
MGDSLFTPKTGGMIGLRNYSASTGFSAPGTRLTAPVPDDGSLAANRKAVFPCGHNHTLLWFVGGDDENDRVQVRLWLWRYANMIDSARASTDLPIYFPVQIGTFDLTLGAMTGPAGGVIGTSNLFADTIAASGTVSVSLIREVWSPADDTAGHILIDTQGYSYLEVQFDINALSPNGDVCNAIAARI